MKDNVKYRSVDTTHKDIIDLLKKAVGGDDKYISTHMEQIAKYGARSNPHIFFID